MERQNLPDRLAGGVRPNQEPPRLRPEVPDPELTRERGRVKQDSGAAPRQNLRLLHSARIPARSSTTTRVPRTGSLRKVIARPEAFSALVQEGESPLGAGNVELLQVVDHHPVGGEEAGDPRGALDHLLEPPSGSPFSSRSKKSGRTCRS